MSRDPLQNATPPQPGDLETLDLEIARAWTKLLKAESYDIDKQMACVDALLDTRLMKMNKPCTVKAPSAKPSKIHNPGVS